MIATHPNSEERRQLVTYCLAYILLLGSLSQSVKKVKTAGSVGAMVVKLCYFSSGDITLFCFSPAGFPMGYAAAAPAYSPNMYPGANPTFQTGMHLVYGGWQKRFAWLWERVKWEGFEKSGYRIRIWG